MRIFKNSILFLLCISLSLAMSTVKVPLEHTFTLFIDSCLSGNINGQVMNTTIPTTLHLDLFRNKFIDDPFFADNHLNLGWIQQCNVTYKKNITFSAEMMSQQVIELVFEGIDTYSSIYFNEQILLETKNAFVQYRAELDKKQIKEGNNQLVIKLFSTATFDQAGQNSERMPFVYAHTRKAAYQYGWDWAPNLNTVGIWKPIYIQGYSKFKIDYIWARNHKVQQEEAVINFAIATKYTKSGYNDISNYKMKITCQNNNQVNQIVMKEPKYNYLEFMIQNPKLWWPNGIGQPYIYEFVAQLINTQNNQVIDKRTIEYGIRTVELNLANSQFTVVLNGYNVYCKGANYVPMDMFYPRTINLDYTPGNTYEKLLSDAVQSHFNMIRVWGGGQYESQEFYRLASRKGLMIFYDFMFSDSIYPAHDQFLANFEVEAKQQLIKARNYPCIVLWCGNNEIYQGIVAWGWKKQNYQQNYKILFEEFIPKILKKYHPDVPYIPSSPLYGIGNAGFSKGGDIHYWGVWAAQSRFESYKTSVGPFNSQFGTQSLPVWETVKNFTASTQKGYEDSGLVSHEKHVSKFSTLKKYIAQYAHRSLNFQKQVYLSGLIQAFGVQIAIKYQRMSKPYSYGTLYWQLNDAWPSISWSSIDYFGRWKPLQYMAKRSYPDVSIFTNDDELSVNAINDNLYAIEALAIVIVQAFDGKVIYQKKMSVSLEQNEEKQLIKLERDLWNDYQDQVVIFTEIIAGRQKQMWSTTFLHPFKMLKLQPSKLYVTYAPEFNLLYLKTDKFIKNLYISHPSHYIKLSDNYFDMIAHKEYKVHLSDEYKLSDIKQGLRFWSYMQIYDENGLEVVFETSK